MLSWFHCCHRPTRRQADDSNSRPMGRSDDSRIVSATAAPRGASPSVAGDNTQVSDVPESFAPGVLKAIAAGGAPMRALADTNCAARQWQLAVRCETMGAFAS